MNPLWMVFADFKKTFFMSLGILVLLAVAFSGTIAMNLFEQGLQQAGAVSSRDFDLVVGAPGSKTDLVLAALYLRAEEPLPLLDEGVVVALANDPRVALVSPLVLADHVRGYPIVGVGEAFPQMRPSLELLEGRWPKQPFEVVAGAATGFRLGDRFYGSHGIGAHDGVDEEVHHEAEYQVVGVLEKTLTPWDRACLTPYQSLGMLHERLRASLGPDEGASLRKVSAILVKPRDFASAYALRSQYQRGQTTAAFPGEVLAGLFSLLDQVKSALTILSALFQTLVFVAVLLSLMAGLPSKARWIGLLRALGAGPGYVFLTLWVQNAAVFTLASLVGGCVGAVSAQTLAAYFSAQTGLAVSVTWSFNETLLLGAFWAIGLAGALVPSWFGYRSEVRGSLLSP